MSEGRESKWSTNRVITLDTSYCSLGKVISSMIDLRTKITSYSWSSP